jgi:hypothetical protein
MSDLDQLMADVRRLKVPPPPYLLLNVNHPDKAERLLSDLLLHDTYGLAAYKWTHLLGHSAKNDEGEYKPILGMLWPEGLQGNKAPILLLDEAKE